MLRTRKAVRLLLSLALFVPGFALLGAFAALDKGERTLWLGLSATDFKLVSRHHYGGDDRGE